MAASVGNWLYETLRHRLAPTALALVVFLDSVAIKLPADFLLAPMAFVKPRSWLKLAGLTTVASVLGGIAMYLIGFLAYEWLGQMALDGFGLQDAFDQFVRQHRDEGAMAIVFATAALVPYKAIALASGVVEMPLWQFVGMSLMVRGVRYGIVSFVSALAGGAIFGDRDGKRWSMRLLDLPLGEASRIVFALALATIVAAWGFELIGGYVPCPLCLQQRWPYYIGVPLAGLAWWLDANDRPGAARLLLALFGVTMLVGAGLGVHHAGVEWKWWAGPAACAIGGGLSGGLPNLETARVIACDQAQWRFLGLSFAGWNGVISLGLAAVALDAARRARG